MADNSIDSQGTEFYVSLDGITALRFDCPTALTNLGYSTSEINIDCIDAVVETKRPGKKSLNSINVPFILQDGSESHRWLLDTTNSITEELPYAVAIPNGSDDPVLTDGVFVPPGIAPNWIRSIIRGSGYIGNLTIDANNGDVIRGSFSFSPASQEWMYKS